MRDCRLTTATVETRRRETMHRSIFLKFSDDPTTRSTKSYLAEVYPPIPEEHSVCRKQLGDYSLQRTTLQAQTIRRRYLSFNTLYISPLLHSDGTFSRGAAITRDDRVERVKAIPPRPLSHPSRPPPPCRLLRCGPWSRRRVPRQLARLWQVYIISSSERRASSSKGNETRADSRVRPCVSGNVK